MMDMELIHLSFNNLMRSLYQHDWFAELLALNWVKLGDDCGPIDHMLNISQIRLKYLYLINHFFGSIYLV